MVAVVAPLMGLAGVTSFGVVSASASSSTFVGIQCLDLTDATAGNPTSVVLTGCDGNTGGSSMPFSPMPFLVGGTATITWTNNLTTTMSLKASSGEKSQLKNESRDAKKGQDCPSGTTEFESQGKTTADTTGSAPVGGHDQAELCFNPPNSITNEPAQNVKIG